MNSNYSSLVKRGVELDYQIKQMTKELDDIKNSLKEAYAESGDKLFMSKDGEACATLVLKSRSTIDVRRFRRAMIEAGWEDKIFDCAKALKEVMVQASDGLLICCKRLYLDQF